MQADKGCLVPLGNKCSLIDQGHGKDGSGVGEIIMDIVIQIKIVHDRFASSPQLKGSLSHEGLSYFVKIQWSTLFLELRFDVDASLHLPVGSSFYGRLSLSSAVPSIQTDPASF